jgi:hypothetical protein
MHPMFSPFNCLSAVRHISVVLMPATFIFSMPTYDAKEKKNCFQVKVDDLCNLHNVNVHVPCQATNKQCFLS